MSYFNNYKSFLKSKYNYDIVETKKDDVNYEFKLVKNDKLQATAKIRIYPSDGLGDLKIDSIQREPDSISGVGKKLLYLMSALAIDKNCSVSFMAYPMIKRNENKNKNFGKRSKQLTNYYNSLGFQRMEGETDYETDIAVLKKLVTKNMEEKQNAGTRKRKNKKRKTLRKIRGSKISGHSLF
jgi:hypothetical protein